MLARANFPQSQAQSRRRFASSAKASRRPCPGLHCLLSVVGMVIKTEVCAFSEDRIYPGHGSRFVRKDGQLIIFSSSKTCKLFHLRKRPAKLTWTTAWRRLNKKFSSIENSGNRRRRRATRVARGFVGASVDDLRSKAKKGKKGGSYAEKAAKREAAKRKARAEARA